MIPLQYNVRSLTVRKATTLATALGIALVVFVLASSQMLAHGIERTMGRSGSTSKALVLRKGADAELTSIIEQKNLGIVLAGPGVKRAKDGSALASGEVIVVMALEKPGTNGQVANVNVRGVSSRALELRPEVRFIAGRPARAGTDEVVIGRRLRGQYAGMDLGQSFELKKNRPVTVVGIFEADGSSFESEVWGDIETIRSSFGRQTIFSSITVALESPAKLDAFKGAIESDKQLNMQVLREVAYFEKQAEGTSMMVSFLGGAIVFFFSLGAMIGAMITMYGAVAGRAREIGTLRALGFSRTTVLGSFLLEALMLALFGGLLGAAASLCMGFVELSLMNQNTWSEIVVRFEATPALLITSILIGGAMGILGGLPPAIRAARVAPVDAMRG